MKSGFMVEVFVRSELPLDPNRALEVLCVHYIVLGEHPPTKEAVEAFANTHTRNCHFLEFAIEPFDIPDDTL